MSLSLKWKPPVVEYSHRDTMFSVTLCCRLLNFLYLLTDLLAIISTAFDCFLKTRGLNFHVL